jgi:NitT/TauT family transport system substrate-binding protein
MRMYRRGLGAGVALAAAASVATAFGAGGTAVAKTTAKAASSGTKVTLVEAGATPGRFLGYVALWGGFFKEEGLNVQLVETASGSQSDQLVAGGQVDFDMGQFTDALNTQMAGEPVDMLANIYTRYANSVIVRTSEKSTVKNFSNLGGIPIGITAVGSGTWQLINFLGTLGNVSASNLHMVGIGGAAIAAGTSLTSGAVDAQVSNDPTDLQLVKSGQAYFLADPMNMNYGVGRNYPAFKKLAAEQYIYNTIFATKAFVSSHPTLTQKFMDALQLAANYVQHEPASKVAALVARNPEEAPFGKTLLTQTVSDAVKVAHSLPKTLAVTSLAYNNTQSFAAQLQSSYSSVGMNTVANNTFANKALKAIGTKAISLKQAQSQKKK